MARIFVHHDKEGKILSIASVETMQEGLPHPYWLEDPSHGVLEAPADDPAFAAGLEHAHRSFRVDVAAGRLVPIEAKTSRSVGH
jgi:hypothetical protein